MFLVGSSGFKWVFSGVLTVFKSKQIPFEGMVAFLLYLYLT